jgi:hypothetical protein
LFVGSTFVGVDLSSILASGSNDVSLKAITSRLHSLSSRFLLGDNDYAQWHRRQTRVLSRKAIAPCVGALAHSLQKSPVALTATSADAFDPLGTLVRQLEAAAEQLDSNTIAEILERSPLRIDDVASFVAPTSTGYGPLPGLRRFTRRAEGQKIADMFRRGRRRVVSAIAILGGSFSGAMVAAHLEAEEQDIDVRRHPWLRATCSVLRSVRGVRINQVNCRKPVRGGPCGGLYVNIYSSFALWARSS